MTRQRISRRDFILAGAVGTGALLTGVAAGGQLASSANSNSSGTLVVARKNGSVAEMVSQCVDSLGGMDKFVHPGSKVAIKVCAGHGNCLANTGREVVRQVVLLAKTADPSEIVVYDHLGGGLGCWPAIASAAWPAGAEPVATSEDPSDYVPKVIPGVDLKSAEVAKVLDEADVLINVPILKTHVACGVSIGLKNHVGTVRDCNDIHPNWNIIHQRIADLNACPTIRTKHRLTVVDAIRPMVTQGPGHGTHAEYNGILAGADPVATDYVGTQIIRRYNPDLPRNTLHVERAAALGLGTNDPAQIIFDERDISSPIPEYGVPLALAGMAALAYRSARSRHKTDRGA